MSKLKTAFFCSNCGNQSPKWLGKCTQCGAWNTFNEEVIERTSKSSTLSVISKQKVSPILISEIKSDSNSRIDTKNNEFNRVLGGGLVPGSVVLLGGEPGIGKSTLLLQVALNMSNHTTLYVSAEESEQQIKMRAERLSSNNDKCYILTENSTQNILYFLNELKPDFVVIDSIQTIVSPNIDSTAGSISQIKETAAELLNYAKTSNVPIVLVGHITKDGLLAGPKVLEHIVDTVLQFEGDRNYGYRILRSIKNRFGSASELGIYEMSVNGLREVSNPSEILITQHESPISGSAIAATIEGLRPLLIEVQALVCNATYAAPQRTCTGFDLKRFNMLLAVIEKIGGFKIGVRDVFLNIAGGVKVNDPAIDLAVVCAVLSSNIDIAIDTKTCFAAEIGLSGELRPIARIEQRIVEAEKLGFDNIIVAKLNNKVAKNIKNKINIVAVSKIEDVFKYLFT